MIIIRWLINNLYTCIVNDILQELEYFGWVLTGAPFTNMNLL